MPRALILLRRDGLLRRLLLPMRALVGNIVSECCAELFAVVCENLRVIASTRNRDIGHAAVEQILCAHLSVHVSEHDRQSVPGWSDLSWHSHGRDADACADRVRPCGYCPSSSGAVRLPRCSRWSPTRGSQL